MARFNRRDYSAELEALVGGSPVLGNIAAQYWTGWVRSPLPSGFEFHHPYVAVLVTEADVFVSWLIKNRLGELLFRVPMTEVKAVMIGPWDSAASYFEWRPTTGLLHGATHKSATSGLVFDLGEGERVLFQLIGPPIEAETRLARVLNSRPPPATNSGS